jgi:hypothetical protein
MPATLIMLASGTRRWTEAARRLTRARAARVARLLELRTAAAGIVSIGEYYVLRARSIGATYSGIAFGLLGTAAIALPFVWPYRDRQATVGATIANVAPVICSGQKESLR